MPVLFNREAEILFFLTTNLTNVTNNGELAVYGFVRFVWFVVKFSNILPRILPSLYRRRPGTPGETHKLHPRKAGQRGEEEKPPAGA